MELILGSQSSARANLLKGHGIRFEQKRSILMKKA